MHRFFAAAFMSLAFTLAVPAFAQEPIVVQETGEACPTPNTKIVMPDGRLCETKYDCTDGTTFTFPENYVWEEGEYSFSIQMDGQKVVCRGEISKGACKSGAPFICEGAYSANVDIEGCPIDESQIEIEEDEHHGHSHGDEEDFDYEPAQDRPYVTHLYVMSAADDISIKISRPVKVFGNFAIPRTLYTQSFSGHKYNIHEPNGKGCLPACRYGAELEVNVGKN